MHELFNFFQLFIPKFRSAQAILAFDIQNIQMYIFIPVIRF